MTEISELNIRILMELRLLEVAKGGKLTHEETLLVLNRYSGGNKWKSATRRSYLVDHGLLKGENTMRKDGSARWFDPCQGPFNFRIFKLDAELLKRVPPLSMEEARALVSRSPDEPPAAPPPAQETVGENGVGERIRREVEMIDIEIAIGNARIKTLQNLREELLALSKS